MIAVLTTKSWMAVLISSTRPCSFFASELLVKKRLMMFRLLMPSAFAAASESFLYDVSSNEGIE